MSFYWSPSLKFSLDVLRNEYLEQTDANYSLESSTIAY